MTEPSATLPLSARSTLCHAFGAGLVPRAANDNGRDHPGDELLFSALRHFAEHGLSAARLANTRAQEAARLGQTDECRYWLHICRKLDRRLAGVSALRLGISLDK